MAVSVILAEMCICLFWAKTELISFNYFFFYSIQSRTFSRNCPAFFTNTVRCKFGTSVGHRSVER